MNSGSLRCHHLKSKGMHAQIHTFYIHGQTRTQGRLGQKVANRQTVRLRCSRSVELVGSPPLIHTLTNIGTQHQLSLCCTHTYFVVNTRSDSNVASNSHGTTHAHQHGITRNTHKCSSLFSPLTAPSHDALHCTMYVAGTSFQENILS